MTSPPCWPVERGAGSVLSWRSESGGKGETQVSDDPDILKRAVERRYGGTATLAQSVPVKETFEPKTAWEGVVHVFDLTGNPKVARAYAWSSAIEGSPKRRFFIVPQAGPINSPTAALRAAIEAEYRGKR